MKRIQFASLALVALLLFGCETPKLQTQSGNPDVTMSSTDTDAIKGQIVNQMLSQGFALVTDTSYTLQFSKQMSGMSGAVYQSLMGNARYSTPTVEIAFNIAKLQDSSRVIATRAVVMQNPFGQVQRNTAPNPQDNAFLQSLLLNVKATVEGVVSSKSSGPLHLRAGLEGLRSVEVAQVKQFASFGAIREFVEKEDVGLIEIATVTYPMFNESEEQMSVKLREHAAQLGAEYVVISKSPEDLQSVLQQNGVSAKLMAAAFKVAPARLGINFDSGLQKKGILLVKSFSPKSKAAAAGLRTGDTITKMDGINPSNYADYAKRAIKWTAGSTIKVAFERDGKPGEADVELF